MVLPSDEAPFFEGTVLEPAPAVGFLCISTKCSLQVHLKNELDNYKLLQISRTS